MWSMVSTSKAADRSRKQTSNFARAIAFIRCSCMYSRAVIFIGVMFRINRLARIKQVVRCKMIRETRFNDLFYDGCRKLGDN